MKITVEELQELLNDYPRNLEVYIGDDTKEIASIDGGKKMSSLQYPTNVVIISIKD